MKVKLCPVSGAYVLGRVTTSDSFHGEQAGMVSTMALLVGRTVGLSSASRDLVLQTAWSPAGAPIRSLHDVGGQRGTRAQPNWHPPTLEPVSRVALQARLPGTARPSPAR